MRKFGYMIMAGMLLCLAGCSDKTQTGQVQENQPIESVGDSETQKQKSTTGAFVSKDYNQDEESIWKTEKGYYYYSYAHGGFRYIDAVTGTEMYLCNKPECKHDGNAFCVATNDKYTVIDGGLYSGRIIANVVEETDTQYLYKLLEIAADGSAANEIVTYFTLEKAGISSFVSSGGTELCIHRNKVLVLFSAEGVEGLEDSERYGVAIVDLDTKKVAYLDEEPFSNENAAITNVDAYGDYFYYCRKEGKKTILHRYNIKDGTDETHKLLVGFQGKYVVSGDGHVVYLKSGGQELCRYDYATGENEEKLKLVGTKKYYMPDGTEFESEEACTAVGIQTDGEYYYVAEKNYTIRKDRNPETGEMEEEIDYARVYVYNLGFEPVTVVNFADIRAELAPEGEKELYGSHTNVKYIGEKVYWTLYDGTDTRYMFSCLKNDFLAGMPKFELEYHTKEK